MTIPSRDRLLDLLQTGLMLAEWELDRDIDTISPVAYENHQARWTTTVNDFKQAIAEIEEADVPHIDGAGSF